MTDEVLDVDGAAALLKVKPSTVYTWAASRQIPARKIGGKWRFSRVKLLEFVSSADAAPVRRRAFVVPMQRSGDAPGRRVG